MHRFLSAFALLCSIFLLTAAPGCNPAADSEVIFGDVGELPDSIEFAVIEGTNPTAQTVQITNSGACALNYTATVETVDSANWLAVLPVSGTVAAASNATLTVSIDVITASLTPALYTGTITIAATCSTNGTAALGSPAAISVNLVVTQNSAVLGVGDDTLEFDVPTLSSATWSSMSTVGAPSDRGAHAAAWSGYELYIAGGRPLGTSTAVSSGAAYNPLSDTWRMIADLPSAGASGTAVWAGGRMVIIGHHEDATAPSPALAYNPTTNAWSTASGTGSAMTARWGADCVVTDGDLVYVWGGFDSSGSSIATNIGFQYDPLTDVATALPATGEPNSSGSSFCALTGDELIVDTSTQLGRLDLGTGTWTTVAIPSAIPSGYVAWTGKRLVAIGQNGHEISSWTRATGQWSAVVGYAESAGLTYNRPVVWTGRTVAFNGIGAIVQYGDFDPETGTTSALGTDISSPGTGRFLGQSTTWTGESLLVFGGWSDSGGTTVAPGGAILQ